MTKKKILVGCLNLESNSSTPYRATEVDFTVRRGAEMLYNYPPAQYFIEHGYDVLPSLYAWSEPSGILKLETYRSFVEELLSAVPTDGSIDGVWLNLHGAMQVEFIGSGEAFLVSQIRERVGPAVPISIALDFHGTVSHSLCRLANILVGFRTAPHTDIEETQLLAAKLLDRAIREDVLPQTKIIKIPLLLPGEYCTTESYPASHIIEELDKIQQLNNVWRASYFTGMTWVDCAHNGNAIVVSGTCDFDGEVSDAMLRLANDIWNARREFRMTTGTKMDPESAVDCALSESGSPVFISDSGDNTTAGAIGDNAYMLDLLLNKNAEKSLVAGIYDSFAVAKCDKAGVGASINISVGAAYDQKSHRVFLENAKVKFIRRAEDGHPLSVLLSIGGVDTIITSSRTDFTCAESFLCCGSDFRNYDIIVVKLGYLFPDLARIASRSIIAMTSGNSMLDVRGLDHTNKRRPIFPVDDDCVYLASKKMMF